MDRCAIVTGGSGALGSAIVEALARDGWSVAFSYLSHAERAQEVATRAGALAVHADLTRSADAQALLDATLERFGRIDALVNNVGLTQVMPFALIEEEDWDRVMAVNLKTMFLATHAVARHMVARKAGVIVNVGSLAGHRLLEVPVHYATAKAGVSGFTLSLARELARYNIRVNAVVPGLLDAGVGAMVPAKELAEYVKYCTAGRPGKPEEVAAVVAFLVSEKARYVNAQNVFVDGGL